MDCRSESEVRAAYRRLWAVAEKLAPPAATTQIVVQQMAERGLEFVCGAVRDTTFGPVVSVGLGGVLVDLIDQTEFALAPVTLDMALQLLRRLGRGRLFGHARGVTEHQAESLADLVVAVSEVMISEPDVLEIDLNPVTVGASQICAVDALVVMASDAEPAAGGEPSPVVAETSR